MRQDSLTLLLADDDPDDRMLALEAFAESHLANPIATVEDGQELLDYLYHRGTYEESKPDRPGIILLDLNMPRMDGREALGVIKADPELRRIPIVVLTTSKAEEDIVRTYDLGVNGFITKPVTFDQLVSTIKHLTRYWFEIVALPPVS